MSTLGAMLRKGVGPVETIGIGTELYRDIPSLLARSPGPPPRSADLPLSYPIAIGTGLCSALAYFDKAGDFYVKDAGGSATLFSHDNQQIWLVTWGDTAVISCRGTEIPFFSMEQALSLDTLLRFSVFGAARRIQAGMTQARKDWEANLLGAMDTRDVSGTFGHQGIVHGRFFDAVQQILRPSGGGLDNALNDFVKMHPRRRVFITGHSQGGGIGAILSAFAVTATPGDAKNPTQPWHSHLESAYLFAPPKVFDASLVNHLEHKAEKAKVSLYSFVNQQDPIPHLPPNKAEDMPRELRSAIRGLSNEHPDFLKFAYGPGKYVYLDDSVHLMSNDDIGQHNTRHPKVGQFFFDLVKRHGMGGARFPFFPPATLTGYLGTLYRVHEN
jgi:hypothetical protein